MFGAEGTIVLGGFWGGACWLYMHVVILPTNDIVSWKATPYEMEIYIFWVIYLQF